MAQLIEVTSITASEMKLNKPVKIPRPPRPEETEPVEDNPYRAAISSFGIAAPPRNSPDAVPAAEEGPRDPSYRAAIATFSAHPPRRLRLVSEGEQQT